MNIGKLNSVSAISASYAPQKNEEKEKAVKPLKTDILTLSRDAESFLEKQKSENQEKSEKSEKNNNQEESFAQYTQLDASIRQMEESKEKTESSVMDFAKCIKIARRIQNGDRVPLKDMKFLAERYPELYKNSLLLKKNNPEPKKYKSVLDEEDEENKNIEHNSDESLDAELSDPLDIQESAVEALSETLEV